MPCYKSGKLMMTAPCYESGNNDNEFDNNGDKVYLLLKRWALIDHMLDHMLDYILD